jgi:hypothetical protein
VTPLSNLLFMISLLLTGFSFLSSQKMPLPLALALSGTLLAARTLTDRMAVPSVAKAPRAPKVAAIPPALLRRITLS